MSPFKPARPCLQAGCGALVGGQGKVEKYCEKHKGGHREDNPRRYPEYQKLYHNKRWHTLRAWHLAGNPLCARCGELADTVHHKVDHQGDYALFMAADNLESLCRSCHSKLTAQDVGFGKRTKTTQLRR